MKTGAGDDPFADPFEEEPEEEPDGEAEPEPTTELDEADSSGSDESTDDESVENDVPVETTSDESAVAESDEGTSDDSLSPQDIPWVLRRGAVKEDRDNVHQFFLRDEYSEREDELRSEIADHLDMRTKDVKKLDLREAMVATADPEAIAAELESWGYEYLK
ncbi:hypothetical protein [Haloarchaeobius sp. DFWS5]|uniref:hypothetical protein n=1 Tax=Haloarchaeobius sp. DFWS5 TaxID=3446114 RepID=UPI003EBB4148